MDDANRGGETLGRVATGYPACRLAAGVVTEAAPCHNVAAPTHAMATLVRPSLVALGFASLLAAQAPDTIRFGRDVRPILADRCFRCHGPDEAERKAGLRLDTRAGATAERDGGAAIVPGSPERSRLWQVVHSDDPGERMPPPSSGKPALTEAQVATLSRWIAAGAEYEPHWAFVPPRRPDVPPARVGNPIDAFLDAELRTRAIEPVDLADRATLARRAFLVLTGLPPTPAETDAFLADEAPDAYERLVDRLLGEEPYLTVTPSTSPAAGSTRRAMPTPVASTWTRAGRPGSGATG